MNYPHLKISPTETKKTTISLGICAGASSVSMVLIDKADGKIEILKSISLNHEGNPAKTVFKGLQELELQEETPTAVTGRKFRHLLNLPTISEPQAIEAALAQHNFVKDGYHTVLSAGGETFMAYLLDDDGKVESVHTGNKCASGTGEFLVQQLGRMDWVWPICPTWKCLNRIRFPGAVQFSVKATVPMP